MKRRTMIQRGEVVVELLRSKLEMCILTEFRINGKEASVWDFGITKDLNKKIAPPSGCGDRAFVPYEHIDQNVLVKYGLDEEGLRDVLMILKKELAIGYCKRCR